MPADDAFRDYLEIVREDPDGFYQDYQQTIDRVANSSALYKGNPVPFLYQPMFFNETDIEAFKRLGATLMTVLNKVIARYTAFPPFRRKFGFPKWLEELILKAHGYSANIPVARVDLFYGSEDSFKFCELNADGSSGMNESNVLEKILLSSQAVVALKKEHRLEYFELLDKWVAASVEDFVQYNHGKLAKPNVAIVDWQGGGTEYEFEEFKKAYKRNGYQTEIADPRALRYTNGRLMFNDMQIDMVYRRLVTGEIIDRQSEIQDFIEACGQGAACVVGPLRSQIIHNKRIFQILHEDETLDLLDEGEREFVRRHIPLTKYLIDSTELLQCAREGKDRYVIKPEDKYASKGVCIGRDAGDREWRERLEACCGKNYLLQEFCQPYSREMVYFEERKLRIKSFNQIIGIFMYNESFAGLYTRVSPSNIIAFAYGCYTLPNYVANPLVGN